MVPCDKVYDTSWNWAYHKSSFPDYFWAINKYNQEIERIFLIHDYHKLEKGKK